MIYLNKQVAIKRTVVVAGGGTEEFTAAEEQHSELVKQLLLNAPYSGSQVNKYKLLDDCYRATGRI